MLRALQRVEGGFARQIKDENLTRFDLGADLSFSEGVPPSNLFDAREQIAVNRRQMNNRLLNSCLSPLVLLVRFVVEISLGSLFAGAAPSYSGGASAPPSIDVIVKPSLLPGLAQ